MPAYIKIYYAFAIYLLLWAISVCIWLTYNVMHYGIGDRESLLATIIGYLILVVTFVKGMVSIKAWQCYRQAIQLTNTARRLFVTMYYCTLLLGMGMLLLDIFVIPDDLKRNYAEGFPLDATIILLDGGILLLTIATFYFAITDRILFKAIRKKQEEDLLSFEVGE